ncbi:MAG: PAS domain-containing protein [Kofleriaceae bacterium]|nr:PAS domain-containing protein [Kofleriaceae bacterium]
MTTQRPEQDARPHTVRWFVRRFHDEILGEWGALASDLPAAKHLGGARLIDAIPDLLEEIASIADESRSGQEIAMARRHALDRLADGFDVSTVVNELSLLRGAMLAVWERRVEGASLGSVRDLNLALDRAIASSVARYMEVHMRTLTGIDRISTASLQASDVVDFLQRLLSVFLDATPAAELGAMLLREGDRMVLRAAVGLDEELARNASLAMGEGFAGIIADTCRPLALDSASASPLVEESLLRGKGVRAFYGIPLVHDGRAIGVAYIGSRRNDELSEADRRYFDSLGARATMGLVHHTLRKELVASEKRLQALADERAHELATLESLLAASHTGIAFLDRDLRYLRVNEAIARINGLPVAEHIGRTIHEILPPEASFVEGLLRHVLDTGEPLINIEARTDDKVYLLNYFPVRATSTIFGVGGIVVDITESARAEEALRIEQARTQSILDHAPAAIWVKDTSGHVIVANRRLASAYGLAHGELIGHRSIDLLPSEVAREHEEHDRIVIAEKHAIEVEEVIPSPTGPRTFLSIKFPIPGPPPLIGGIATEITERKQMEEQLRIAVRSRDEMMAVVSHDLRSPLATIQLATGTLLAEIGDEPRKRRMLEMITRAGWRMHHLINDLLATANIRAGRLQLDLRPEAAEPIAREAFEVHQQLADEKGIGLAMRVALGQAMIIADRDRLLQVFANLLGNALKFCRAGDQITIGGVASAREVRFSVTDTGPGIPDELLPKLFDPYVSGAAQRKAGAGLGLYISRGIVEGHGGRIWVESTLGHGATFWFTVPIARQVAPS